MSKKTFQTEVTLKGYQAIFKPSKFGYSLSARINQEMVDKLIVDREELVRWCMSKLKNPKRCVEKPEPWEQLVGGDNYKVKFSWNEDSQPIAFDCDLNQVSGDETIPLFEGNRVEIVFYQKPYILKDGVTYGTSLKLLCLQVITIGGVEEDREMDVLDAKKLFKRRDGWVYSQQDDF